MGKPDTYHSSVNRDLLAMIPPNSNRVLELGCGTGALGVCFKQINHKTRYVGVEVDPESVDIAAGNLDFVYSGTIEDGLNDESFKSEEPFDCIICGDVLEHLVDPHSVLRRLVQERLKGDGSVIACVPNVQNISVVMTLLSGDWPRHDAGIFDLSHLRWFTKKSLIEMFEKAGLSVAKIRPRVFGNDGVKQLAKAARDLGLPNSEKDLEEGFSAFQWLIHGVKGELPKRKVLVRGFPAEACCARPRLSEPGAFINTVPGFRYSESPTEVEPGESVVVVRQRFNIDKEAVVKHLKDGCLIVGEWDDDPWYEGFKDRLKGLDVEWAIKACHAIQVSTEAIAELIMPINPNVVVFPNQIKEIKPAKEFDRSAIVTRVFMGGQRHREDWEDAVKEVNRIVALNPDRYHFVVVHDRELFGALETTHKTFYALQPYEKYRELIRSCDVAISTLADNRFNRCKSDITMIECFAEGTHFLDGSYGREVDSITDDTLVIHVDGDDGLDNVRNVRLLRDHYRSRVDWINGLLDRKAELDQQLFARLPELKETK